MRFTRRYEFAYSYPPEAASRRLLASLEQEKWSSIVAQVTSTQVKLHQRPPLAFRNSFNPVFVGRFTRTPSGATLSGTFRMSWFAVVFLFVFLGMFAYGAMETYIQPEHRAGYVEGWRSATLRWNLVFLGFAALAPMVGWLVGLPSRNAIIRAIHESI